MRRDRSDGDVGTKEFAHYQCGERRPGKLCHPVRHHVGCIHFTPDQDAQGHSRIVMRARDMAAGENHHHERRPDRERRDHTRACANSRAANCEDEEKGSDEFGYVFVHKLNFVGQGTQEEQAAFTMGLWAYSHSILNGFHAAKAEQIGARLAFPAPVDRSHIGI